MRPAARGCGSEIQPIGAGAAECGTRVWGRLGTARTRVPYDGQVNTLACGLVMVSAAACAAERPVVNGGALLNVQPASRPTIVGNYDFDLLGPVRGKACVKEATTFGRKTEYWIGALPFEGTPPRDSLTLGAIAAASTDAIDKISGADTILLTRVLTEGKSSKEVCAYVYGRAVRLKKAVMHDDPHDSTDEDKDSGDAAEEGSR